MSFQSKLPPIVVQIKINAYNNLIYFLENSSTEASLNIKENLLKYSYPLEDAIEIRLFPKEASYLIYILISYLSFSNIPNYYKLLKSNKQNFVDERRNNVKYCNYSRKNYE